MTIYQYCRRYRLFKGVNQSELGNFKTISSFERGLSSNINHFIKYLELARKLNDEHNFLNGIKGVKNV